MGNQEGPQEQTRLHVTLWVYDKAQQIEVPLVWNSEGGGIPVTIPAQVITDLDTIAAQVTLIATDIDTISTNIALITTDVDAIATSQGAIATQTTTISTQTTTIATNTGTSATQLTNINAKLPALDANSRFKISNVTSWVYGGIVQLNSTTTTIATVTSRSAVKIIFANMDSSARTFQYGIGTTPLTDATSVEKSHPLSVGEPYEVILDGLASTTVYGLCSSANTVNATYWTALL